MAVTRQPTSKKYKFKSVGVAYDIKLKNQQSFRVEEPQVGIKTPLALSDIGENSFLRMNTSFADQVHDNLINLLLTNHGERLAVPDFGANLKELAFEMTTGEGQDKAMQRITKAIGKFMPFVIPLNFQPIVDFFENKEVAKIGVRMSYEVPKLNVKERGLEVIIFSAG